MMLDLDIRLLRSFLTVVETGSITASAQRLDRTQPAVSLQIQKLEALLGGALFDRTERGLVLTRRGELLLPYAEQMVDINDRLCRAMDRVPPPRPAPGARPAPAAAWAQGLGARAGYPARRGAEAGTDGTGKFQETLGWMSAAGCRLEARDIPLGEGVARLELEQPFWQALDDLTAREGLSLAGIVLRVGRDGPARPLEEGLRAFVIRYFAQSGTPPGGWPRA